jgi:hypothetical protein
MMCRFLIVFVLLGLFGCDDGDIITFELEFDGDLKRCENNLDSYLIFDVKDDPSETLSLSLQRTAENEALFREPTPENEPAVLPINGSSTRFIFRTYNRTPTDAEMCDVIAPGDLVILEDYEATTGRVFVAVTIEDDDNDGIPSIFEGRGEPDADGNYPNAQNSDGDIYPDYLDADDDNDNIPTEFEIITSDGDFDPAVNFINTDEALENQLGQENIPNHLDPDDDGDNIPTRLEDMTDQRDPRDLMNRVVDENGEDIFRYLYFEAMEPFPDFGLRDDYFYTRSVEMRFTITEIDLDVLRQDVLDFGTFRYNFDIDQESD